MYSSLLEPGYEGLWEYKLRSIETKHLDKGHQYYSVSPGDSDCVDPGGRGWSKKEIHGRCNVMKVANGSVCKTLWGLSESLSK